MKGCVLITGKTLRIRPDGRADCHEKTVGYSIGNTFCGELKSCAVEVSRTFTEQRMFGFFASPAEGASSVFLKSCRTRNQTGFEHSDHLMRARSFVC